MYISDINYYKKNARIFIFISLFTLIFSLIYEMFSHNVFSIYMMFSPLIPLILGTFMYYFMYFTNKKIMLKVLNVNIHNSIILTLTLCSIFKGVLDIYGTTNSLIIYYLYASLLLIILNVVLIIVNKRR